MIRVVCDGCGKTIKAPEKYAGRNAKCPGCGSAVSIPAAAAPAPVEAEPPVVTHAPRFESMGEEAARMQGAPPADSLTKECPFCAEEIAAAAVKCKHCGEFLNQAPAQQRPLMDSSHGQARAVQTTEATGKTWKLLQLLGALGFIGGATFFVLGGLTMGQDGSAGGVGAVLATLGMFGFLGGVGAYVVGRVGGWWFHG